MKLENGKLILEVDGKTVAVACEEIKPVVDIPPFGEVVKVFDRKYVFYRESLGILDGEGRLVCASDSRTAKDHNGEVGHWEKWERFSQYITVDDTPADWVWVYVSNHVENPDKDNYKRRSLGKKTSSGKLWCYGDTEGFNFWKHWTVAEDQS